MAVEIRGEYTGDLRVAAVHGPSGSRLTTEAPADNGGRGESFSPTDLVAVALGTCMLTIMGIVARRSGIRLEGTRFRVEKHMSGDLPRRIVALPVVFDMPAGLSQRDRQKLEGAAATCPVKKSLDPAIDVTVAFRYPGEEVRVPPCDPPEAT